MLMSEDRHIFFNNPSRVSFRKPFPLVAASNLLADSEWESLRSEFPSSSIVGHQAQGEVKKFLEYSPSWKEFIDHLNCYDFISPIWRHFYLDLALIGDRSIPRRVLPWSLGEDRNKIGRPVELSFSFIRSSDGSYLEPHTDTTRKLVSLIFYFPDDDWETSWGGQTRFYRLKNNEKNMREKWVNWRNEDLFNRLGKRQFFDDFEVFFSPKFMANSGVMFLKTNMAWHDVSPVRLDGKSKSRNVFLMNINLV